ncbi:hypothetical protein JTB14_015270 [Gonioctena quinquepunctata]|nr:hypothetical protein JTB14_015270 [Gonioctena quinquepunctata]
MELHGLNCSGDNQQRRFINPNRRMKHVPKKAHPPPIVPVQNRFAISEEAVKSVEKTDPLPIQKTIQAESMQVETSNSNNKVLKPPPIVIREKKHWPKIIETLKNLGIKTVRLNSSSD